MMSLAGSSTWSASLVKKIDRTALDCWTCGSRVGLSRGKMSVVDVELLVVPDCPNESVALSVLRLAFDRVGLAAQLLGDSVGDHG